MQMLAVAVLAAVLALQPVLAAPPEPPPAWTWEQLDAEWTAIRAAVPVIPPLGAGLPQPGEIRITRSERGWTWCGYPRPDGTCYMVLIGLPDEVTHEAWQAILWHEAGHAHYYLYPSDLQAYARRRGMPYLVRHPIRERQTMEVYAEDFRACFGPRDSPVQYLVPGVDPPDDDVCEWMLGLGPGT